MRLVQRVKGIHAVKKRLASGVVHTLYYHRETRIRLPDDPTSAAFLEAWRAAEANMRPSRPTGTIEALIEGFRESADWNDLRESTRSIMKLNLNAVAREFGSMPIAALEDRRCRSAFLDWRDELAKVHPRAADAKLSALQRVLSWAHDRGLVAVNPLEKFRRAYSADRSEKIWLPEHVEAIERVAPADVVFMMTLALHTGQRQDDLLRLTWAAFDGAALTLVQSKSRRRVFIPCTDALKAALTQKGLQDPRGLFIACRDDGRPWTKDAFKKAWASAYKAAGIAEGLHYHDLRGTAVTMLAEAGATVPEIAAITGHSLASATRIVEVYMARTKALASAGIAKLNDHARRRLIDKSEGKK
jgi:integrase